MRSWCILHAVESKENKQREFKAPLNTVVTDKVWQGFLPQNHTCFKHCFQWCAFVVWGEPHTRRAALHVPVWKCALADMQEQREVLAEEE